MYEYTSNRLTNAPQRIQKYIDKNIVDWTEQEILDRIKLEAIQRGLANHVINSMRVEKTGFMKCSLIWDYKGPDGQPVAVYLEKGTKKHEIRAKGKAFGGADFLSWINKFNLRIFRKKVKHPGTTGLFLMRDGYKKYKNQLKRRIIEEVNEYLELTRLS